MIFRLLILILLGTIFIVPQSFGIFKLPLLGLLIFYISLNIVGKRLVVRSKLFLFYYFYIILLALFWSYIGLLNNNPSEAIVDSVRVYCVFMFFYFFITIYVSNCNYTDAAEKFFSYAALGISLFCFYVLADALLNLNYLDGYIKEQMLLEIGIHDGYTQMNNVNIGMFCFILPFLLSNFILNRKKSVFQFIIILISVMSVVLASRRIILVLFILTPILTYIICLMASKNNGVGATVGFFYLGIFIFVSLSLLYIYIKYPIVFDGFTTRIMAIFSIEEDSLRGLQNQALLKGFSEHIFFGSGFGGITEVIRNSERPWTYELTYSRLLFNSGIVGILLLTSLFAFTFVKVIAKIRRLQQNQHVYISLLVGMFGVFIASASNPYLSSFDFIFALSILPLILNSRDHKEPS